MTTLVTGAAGFIGFHTAKTLCERGDNVVGIDNLNDYYDVQLKEDRLHELKIYPNFKFIKLDLVDREGISSLFQKYSFQTVINLAAQAGVRYSLENPHAYIDSNIVGFCNILEGCRHHNVKNLVFASSSSVYGANTKKPFSEHDNVDHPLALYAASKKANELMAHAYANLYNLPCTGLRFFTVYGPWGRPDMALFLFTKNILEGKPIDVFNNGNMMRDFTYIDDIVAGIVRAHDKPAQPNTAWNSNQPDPATSYAPYRIYNIGNGNPSSLMNFIHAIEKHTHKKAILNMMPLQPGDVPETSADTSSLCNELGYTPQTTVDNGVKNFIDWYQKYYEGVKIN